MLFAGFFATIQAAEFQVPINGIQDQERPQAVQLAGGAWVAVWEDESSGRSEVYLRLFNTNGVALIAPVRAHPDSLFDQAHPAVTGLSNGTFVVAWSSRNLDGSSYGVALRRFRADGSPLDSGPVQANVTTEGPQFHPQVAMLDSGQGFVLVFVGQTSAGNQDIYFRRFTVNGTPLETGDNPVNTLGIAPVAAGDQGSPAVAGLRGGGFAIAFEDRFSEDVYAVRFQPNGIPATAPGGLTGMFYYRVHTNAAFLQGEPAVAGLSNGNYVVAWTSETNGTPDSRQIGARLFTMTGPVGDEWQVGSVTPAEAPDVAGLPNGDFTIGWQGTVPGGDGSLDSSIWVQRFSLTGSPRIASLRINEYDIAQQRRVCLVPFQTSGYGALWESFGQDGSRDGVFARLFEPNIEIPGFLQIKIAGRNGPGPFRVSFTGQPGRWHELQATSASNLTGWVTLLATNPPTGTFNYLDSGAGIDRRFFRVYTP